MQWRLGSRPRAWGGRPSSTTPTRPARRGYHDLTTTGLPIGKVFAKTTFDAGDLVSVTLSHEVLETLGDPDINLIVQKGSRAYAYEVFASAGRRSRYRRALPPATWLVSTVATGSSGSPTARMSAPSPAGLLYTEILFVEERGGHKRPASPRALVHGRHVPGLARSAAESGKGECR